MESPSIWKNIRIVEGLSQEKMAETFDITTKRYQRIEKMEVQPDAEILYKLYCLFQYSPLVILEREMYYLDELNHIWEKFPEHLKKKLTAYLEAAMEFAGGL